MPQPLENLRQVRLEKLKKLRELGVEPYPAQTEVRSGILEIRKQKLGSKVRAAGRLMGWREHGSLIFADLRGEGGQVQLAFRQGRFDKKNWHKLNLLDRGDFIAARGKLYQTQAGELTVEVSDFQLLTKSLRPLPTQHFGLQDVETRYRERYVDLNVNPAVREVFEKRTQIITVLRELLNQHGFLEVETPTLQPIYGGASAKPFTTHHNTLDTNFYLRISDELYLKRLIVGGFEKVYEVCKDFRNEGLDRQHNPEFTMLEFYWAYTDYEQLMEFTEEMVTTVMQEVLGSIKVQHADTTLDFSRPWKRITFRELLLQKTKIDIDTADTEEKLTQEINSKGIKLNLKGVVGFGALVDQLYKEIARPTLIQPTLLLDHPSAMMVLAKKKEGNSKYVASFQLLAKGFEIIKAYNELNDPLDQRKRWQEEEELGKQGLRDHQALDEDYLRALEYGLPPTVGWGMGIDRFVALLTDQPSVKDVILFPTLRPL